MIPPVGVTDGGGEDLPSLSVGIGFRDDACVGLACPDCLDYAAEELIEPSPDARAQLIVGMAVRALLA